MWLILSFFNAAISGVQNAYYKKANIQINPILLAWTVLVVSSLLLSPLLLLGTPHLNNTFWIAIGLRLIFDTIAFTLYIKGVQLSPLSLTIPMLSLTALLLIITQFFINHLFPSYLGLIGVFTVIGGVYFLHFDHDTKHLLSPFKAIWKEKGVRYVSIAAILWSFVTAFQKLGIDNSNPFFYTAFFQLFWALCFTPIAIFADRKGFKNLFNIKMAKGLVPAGIMDGIQILAQYTAYALALPLYVNVIGQTQILFSSFFGWLFYKEKLQKHIIPTIFIVIGIILITFAQR